MNFKKIIYIITILFYSISVRGQDITTHFHFSANDLKHAETAIYFAEKGKWQEAEYSADIVRNNIIKKMILWMKYKSSIENYNFYDISNFIKENENWPDINILIQNAENSINNKTDKSIVQNWFKYNPPTTGNGFKYFALFSNEESKIDKIIKQGWIMGSFISENDQDEYYKRFYKILDYKDHIERVDELIFRKRITQAKRLMNKLDQHHKILFEARINLIQNNKLPDLRKININLRKDPGLIYDLLKYYDSKDDVTQIRDILKNTPLTGKYADKGWKIKIKQIREMIGEKKYIVAYSLSKSHNSKDLNNYAEGEWLAGWIAYSFLGKKDLAYIHFNNLYKNVKSPISKSRAAYWLGRTGKGDFSKDWYKKSSIYPETFYGQLSISSLGGKFLTIPHHPAITAIDLAQYKENELVKGAFILMKLQKLNQAFIFLKSAIESAKTSGQVALMSELGHNFNKLDISIKTAKEASKRNILISKFSYPLIKYINKIEKPEKSLILSIIRQESLFDQEAESKAGAAGLMQLMPATARELSKELNLNFSQKNLKSDPEYNIELGSYYLDKLINYFDGSYILAIAAYNAGITNVTKWINDYGDPREYKDIKDIINWLELIPFYETRNYVQRVIENLQIYRSVTNNKTTAILNIDKDLHR